MEDYPANLMDFEARFATEKACREYLFQLRWPDGFRCPRCDGDKAWATDRGLWHCAACGHQVSVTAGTVQDLHRTGMSLVVIEHNMRVIMAMAHSAVGLQQ